MNFSSRFIDKAIILFLFSAQKICCPVAATAELLSSQTRIGFTRNNDCRYQQRHQQLPKQAMMAYVSSFHLQPFSTMTKDSKRIWKSSHATNELRIAGQDSSGNRGTILNSPITQKGTFLKSNDSDSSISASKATPQNLIVLMKLLQPRFKRSHNADKLSPISWAYIGDVIFELFIRVRYVYPDVRTSDLQKLVTGTVNADSQSEMLVAMLASSFLTAQEQSIVKRGQDVISKRKSGLGGKNNRIEYQNSTGFEALLGYIYMTDTSRFLEVLLFLQNWLDDRDNC